MYFIPIWKSTLKGLRQIDKPIHNIKHYKVLKKHFTKINLNILKFIKKLDNIQDYYVLELGNGAEIIED